MMAETCLLAESAICYPPLYDELKAIQPRPTATVETVAIAAVAAASEQNADAILILSTSGNTARLVSKYRPRVPIITGKSFLVALGRSEQVLASNTQRANCATDSLAPRVLPILLP